MVSESIRRADVIHRDVLRQPLRAFTGGLSGRSIERVKRRGKNVIIGLDSGSVLAINLGMTGNLLLFGSAPRGGKRPTHPTVILRFASGAVLFFNDTRRFGTAEFLQCDAWQARSDRMGPEPLSEGYTAARMVDDLSRSRSPARSWLLDQRKIAGVGNIYANEALYLAGVHPARPANAVTESEAVLLHQGLRDVLNRAIAAGGTTLRDYRNADGEVGGYKIRLRVYGREGAPCLECGRAIERMVLSNRSAFFCPVCQLAR